MDWWFGVPSRSLLIWPVRSLPIWPVSWSCQEGCGVYSTIFDFVACQDLAGCLVNLRVSCHVLESFGSALQSVPPHGTLTPMISSSFMPRGYSRALLFSSGRHFVQNCTPSLGGQADVGYMAP